MLAIRPLGAPDYLYKLCLYCWGQVACGAGECGCGWKPTAVYTPPIDDGMPYTIEIRCSPDTGLAYGQRIHVVIALDGKAVYKTEIDTRLLTPEYMEPIGSPYSGDVLQYRGSPLLHLVHMTLGWLQLPTNLFDLQGWRETRDNLSGTFTLSCHRPQS